jgi:hypothetical protein
MKSDQDVLITLIAVLVSKNIIDGNQANGILNMPLPAELKTSLYEALNNKGVGIKYEN